MLFGRFGSGASRREDAASADRIRIDYDMMLKGFVYKRRSGVVRQFGVTVEGATRLVTSGDLVDRPTYEALVRAGAVRPLPVSGAETSASKTNQGESAKPKNAGAKNPPQQKSAQQPKNYQDQESRKDNAQQSGDTGDRTSGGGQQDHRSHRQDARQRQDRGPHRRSR